MSAGCKDRMVDFTFPSSGRTLSRCRVTGEYCTAGTFQKCAIRKRNKRRKRI